jgi:protein-disulfide isomerase
MLTSKEIGMASKLSGLLLAAAFTMSAVSASALPAYAFDNAQKKEIGELVHQYLVEHPEVLLEAQDALQAKREQDVAAKAAVAIEQNKKALFSDPSDLVLGNPKGDVTIVEFYDYNCTYCKHAMPDMTSLIKADSNVRFVLKEFPILGDDSIAAHKVAAAFRAIEPAKYGAFHMALLGGQAHADAATALKVAESLGVTKAQISKEIAANAGEESIKQSYQLADALGIRGTPAYVIGDDLIPGAAGLDTLAQKVANMRSCGKADC